VIVLDANILISFVLGKRVRELMETYQARVRFFAPEVVFEDAARYLPSLLAKPGKPDGDVAAALEYAQSMVEPIGPELYEAFEGEACARLRGRDEEDWPVVATALALGCPVWTEDRHFFGTGLAVWDTAHIEIFFESPIEPPDEEETNADWAEGSG
jgi:predicted nucleic acid-binding protein